MSKIIKSFCYWYGPMKTIQHLFFKSFLQTQPENFVMDVFVENCNNTKEFFAQYSLQELNRINVITMNWDQIVDKTLIFHDFNTLKRENLALLSDYCRILTFIKTTEYTFYFDMDIVFLYSFVPFLNYRCFVYTWGKSESGNSAIIKADHNTSIELRRLLILNRSPHPLMMFKKTTNKISILTCALFDPQWFTEEFDLPFNDNDVSRLKMQGYVTKYNSYAVHWHNKWNTDPNLIPKSWIYSQYNKYVNGYTNPPSWQSSGIKNLLEFRSLSQSSCSRAPVNDNLQILRDESVKSVTNCTYGTNNYNVDVTDMFRVYFIRNGKVIINKNTSFNDIFGDPVRGVSKRLRFHLNGSNYVVNEYRSKNIELPLNKPV